MEQTGNTALLPPRSRANEGREIFTERYVIMRGGCYYLRVFSDGNSELSRYDAAAKKWVFLCFPPDKKRA